MYSKVLVPVDLSHEEIGARILKIAAKLLSDDGEVTLMHVVPDIPTYVDTFVPPQVRQETIDASIDDLVQMAAAAGVKARVEVGVGIPHIRILDECRSWAPDLVIIGSHRPGLRDYFLGSTAARVVRHAECSVLVDR